MSTDDKIDALQATIGGPDGVLVRLAVAEHSLRALGVAVGRIETEILEHRRSSSDAHRQTLDAIKAANDTTIRLDGSTRWIAGVIVAVISGLGGIGGLTVVRQVSAPSAASASTAPPVSPQAVPAP